MKLRVEPRRMARSSRAARPGPNPIPSRTNGWSNERTSILNHQGSPGIYADAPFEVFFDNVKVTPNR